jgi:hypothetical protein
MVLFILGMNRRVEVANGCEGDRFEEEAVHSITLVVNRENIDVELAVGMSDMR